MKANSNPLPSPCKGDERPSAASDALSTAFRNDGDLALEDAPESIREPAKRWRNKWLVNKGSPRNLDDWSHLLGSGPGVYDSPRSWPTRADAEEDARRILLFNRAANRHVPFHLGAFPVEDAP